MHRRSIMGPIILITLGVLFSLDYIWGMWDFWRTWPILLVVIGIVKLVERMAWEDHAYQPPNYPPNFTPGGPRPWAPPPPPPPPAGTSDGVLSNPGDSNAP